MNSVGRASLCASRAGTGVRTELQPPNSDPDLLGMALRRRPMGLEGSRALPRRSAAGPPAVAAPVHAAVAFHYTQTESFVAGLRQLAASLLAHVWGELS